MQRGSHDSVRTLHRARPRVMRPVRPVVAPPEAGQHLVADGAAGAGELVDAMPSPISVAKSPRRALPSGRSVTSTASRSIETRPTSGQRLPATIDFAARLALGGAGRAQDSRRHSRPRRSRSGVGARGGPGSRRSRRCRPSLTSRTCMMRPLARPPGASDLLCRASDCRRRARRPAAPGRNARCRREKCRTNWRARTARRGTAMRISRNSRICRSFIG